MDYLIRVQQGRSNGVEHFVTSNTAFTLVPQDLSGEEATDWYNAHAADIHRQRLRCRWDTSGKHPLLGIQCSVASNTDAVIRDIRSYCYLTSRCKKATWELLQPSAVQLLRKGLRCVLIISMLGIRSNKHPEAFLALIMRNRRIIVRNLRRLRGYLARAGNHTFVVAVRVVAYYEDNLGWVIDLRLYVVRDRRFIRG